jgi:hypothetical protein
MVRYCGGKGSHRVYLLRAGRRVLLLRVVGDHGASSLQAHGELLVDGLLRVALACSKPK